MYSFFLLSYSYSGVPVVLLVTKESKEPSSSPKAHSSTKNPSKPQPISSFQEISLQGIAKAQYKYHNTSHNKNDPLSSNINRNKALNVSEKEDIYADIIYSTMIMITKVYEQKDFSKGMGCRNIDLFQNLCGAFILECFEGGGSAEERSFAAEERSSFFSPPVQSLSSNTSHSNKSVNSNIHKMNLRELLDNNENYSHIDKNYNKKQTKLKKNNKKIENLKNLIINCHNCLSTIIQRLAEFTLPIPILSRAYPSIWLSQLLNNSYNHLNNNSKNIDSLLSSHKLTYPLNTEIQSFPSNNFTINSSVPLNFLQDRASDLFILAIEEINACIRGIIDRYVFFIYM